MAREEFFCLVAIPALAMVANVVVQAGFCRLWKFGLFGSIVLGAAGGFLWLLASFFFVESGPVWVYATCIFLYGCFSFWYFTALNLGETSIRIRMLERLRESPDFFSPCDLTAGQTVEEVLERRIHRLAAKGIIAVAGDRIAFRFGPFFLACLPLVVLKRLFHGSVPREKERTRNLL